MPGWPWLHGGSTTTPFGRTAAWVIYRQPITPSSAPRHRNGTGRCAQSGATRPAPLPHRAEQAQMTNRLYSSLDEKRGSGHTTALDSQESPQLRRTLEMGGQLLHAREICVAPAERLCKGGFECLGNGWRLF